LGDKDLRNITSAVFYHALSNSPINSGELDDEQLRASLAAVLGLSKPFRAFRAANIAR
jgi:hypothetical protein